MLIFENILECLLRLNTLKSKQKKKEGTERSYTIEGKPSHMYWFNVQSLSLPDDDEAAVKTVVPRGQRSAGVCTLWPALFTILCISPRCAA